MTLQPIQPTVADLSNAYDVYYTSGSYDVRYPRPNPGVLNRARHLLDPQSHLLDFGCGSGRYLLALKDQVRLAAGFDISMAALQILKDRSERQGGAPLHLLGPDPDDMARHVDRNGPADVILCLFGVLAHVTPRAARIEALSRIREALVPGGRLLASFPNAARRFAREQRAAGPESGGAITYLRKTNAGDIVLPYQLYNPERLTAELTAAGFSTEGLWAESVFPEAWLLRDKMTVTIDGALGLLCPARWGYGLLVQAVVR